MKEKNLMKIMCVLIYRVLVPRPGACWVKGSGRIGIAGRGAIDRPGGMEEVPCTAGPGLVCGQCAAMAVLTMSTSPPTATTAGEMLEYSERSTP